MDTELLEQTPETLPEEMPVEQSIEAPLDAMLDEVLVSPMDVTDRLAAEFFTITEEFPQVVSPADLPDSVMEVAVKEGIPLLDAYLRYRWQEEKRIAAATACRQKAAQSSAGSLSRGALETPPEQDAFLRAFRSAL